MCDTFGRRYCPKGYVAEKKVQRNLTLPPETRPSGDARTVKIKIFDRGLFEKIDLEVM